MRIMHNINTTGYQEHYVLTPTQAWCVFDSLKISPIPSTLTGFIKYEKPVSDLEWYRENIISPLKRNNIIDLNYQVTPNLKSWIKNLSLDTNCTSIIGNINQDNIRIVYSEPSQTVLTVTGHECVIGVTDRDLNNFMSTLTGHYPPGNNTYIAPIHQITPSILGFIKKPDTLLNNVIPDFPNIESWWTNTTTKVTVYNTSQGCYTTRFTGNNIEYIPYYL